MQTSILTILLLPLALGLVMLGMGLSLVPDDFKRILESDHLPGPWRCGSLGHAHGFEQRGHRVDHSSAHQSGVAPFPGSERGDCLADRPLPGFLAQVGLAVVLLNLVATATGFVAGGLFRLPWPQRVCIAIEVGIQNGTLAIAITAGLLKNNDMAIPAAVYSLLMYSTGLIIIFWGQRAIQASPPD